MVQRQFHLQMGIISEPYSIETLETLEYTVTKDGYVVMSSETGVTEIEPKNVVTHGRLEPGRMFLVDMNEAHYRRQRNQRHYIFKTALSKMAGRKSIG